MCILHEILCTHTTHRIIKRHWDSCAGVRSINELSRDNRTGLCSANKRDNRTGQRSANEVLRDKCTALPGPNLSSWDKYVTRIVAHCT